MRYYFKFFTSKMLNHYTAVACPLPSKTRVNPHRYLAKQLTSAAMESGVLCQRHQFGVDHLICLLEYTDEIVCLFDVIGGEEGVGSSGLSGSGSASNTMYIVLRWRWVVKVYHESNVSHICYVALRSGKTQNAAEKKRTKQIKFGLVLPNTAHLKENFRHSSCL